MSKVKKLEKIAKYWVNAVQSPNGKYKGKSSDEFAEILGWYKLLRKAADGNWAYFGDEPGLKKYPSVKKELDNVN